MRPLGGRATAAVATALATTLTALIDGFWLERALDPQAFSAAEARRAALMVAERFLGQGAVIQLDS